MGFEFALLFMASMFVVGGLVNIFVTGQVIDLDKEFMPRPIFLRLERIGFFKLGFIRFIGCLAVLAGISIAMYAVISLLRSH